MPHNPAFSVPVVGYPEPAVHRRMKRIQKARPRWTVSAQIIRCLELGLPLLEQEAGLKPSAPTKS